MDGIKDQLDWATSKGIILNGIEPKVLPGRGIGIVSTRDIKQGEAILTVPNNVLRRLDNTSKSIRDALAGSTVHALLAASMAFDLKDPPQDFEIWKGVMPTKADIKTLMPLCWSSDLQDLLPQSGKDLLLKQKVKFQQDWSMVSTAYPAMSRDDYLWSWLLVNTRTFYHTTPKTRKDLPKEDHMVLQPVADLFNHSPQGCYVEFTREGFTFTTTTATAAGDEMFIQYGSHSNDFLLVEYGFILPSDLNSFDEVSLDAYILPRLSKNQKELLDSKSFLGAYMLDSETICYRTQVAIRAMILTTDDWLDFLDGHRAENTDQRKVDDILLKALKKFREDIEGMKERVNDVSVGDVMRTMLRDRWQQIQGLVDEAIVRITP